MNIAELTENEIRNFGEHVLVMYEEKDYTNVELDRTARRLGNVLKKLGVKRGDRVIIQMPNYAEIGPCFSAVWKIGAVVVPMNYLVGEEETAYIYQDCGAEIVISSSEFIPKIEVCRVNAPNVRNVILIDKEVPEGYLSFWKLVDKSSDELETLTTKDDELAVLVYTAGTTGRPKGCMHTHLSLYAAARIVNDSTDTAEGRIGVSVLPLCHMYGVVMMNAADLQGGWKFVILHADMEHFDLEQLFDAIEKYKGTSFAGVPIIYILMGLYPESTKYDLSSMKLWTSTTAPLSMETWKGFKDKYGFEILEGWACTESGGIGCFSPLGEPVKVGSIGKPMSDTEVKIVDNNGNELHQGQEGELIIRCPALMEGYWNKPDETAEVLRDGWLYTGDIGYVDEDGYFFITDRKKNLIIKGGHNISPRQIEEVIFAHPKVAETAVVGMKDDLFGEDIKAFVVLKPGEQATAAEIVEYCHSRLTPFKSPREVQFLDSLPKNLMGKVLKRELRELC